MRHRRSRPTTLAGWPPALHHLVRAAAVECPPGHSATLRDLTTLALRKVPARGIFHPGTRDEYELYAAIESVAQAHLELSEARRAWCEAMDAAHLTLERRDAVETTALHLQSVSDTAYFYAGLAFGLTFAYLWRAP